MWRKILIGVAVAIPLAYGGIKLYVAHSIRKSADQVIALLSPVAEIRYTGTTSSLGGMVGITGVTVQSRTSDDFYRINAIEVSSDNLLTLLDLDERLRKGEVPKHFAIEVHGATIPVGGLLLDKSGGDLGLMGGMRLPFGALACDGRSRFSAADLEQMGIEEITTSVKMDVRREAARNEIAIRLVMDTPGINAADINLHIAATNGRLSPQGAASTLPPLDDLDLKFRDQGWHKRVQSFCARERHSTPEAYLAAHMAAVKQALARMGISVGNTLLAGYRDFLRPGGRLEVSISPQGPIDLQTLHLYGLQDGIAYLGLELDVNGKRIAPIEIAKATPVPDAGDDPAPVSDTGEDQRFTRIRLNELARHIGEQVRLTTDTQGAFTGELTKVEDRAATLRVTAYGRIEKKLVLLTRVEKAEVAAPPKVH